MNREFTISKECKDAFLVGYPVDELYISRNLIPGNDYIVELMGHEIVTLKEVRK